MEKNSGLIIKKFDQDHTPAIMLVIPAKPENWYSLVKNNGQRGYIKMSSKRERYLQLKHDLLSSCGQCIGFRARGVSLESGQAKPACSTAIDCHKSCPVLGMGGAAAAAREKRSRGRDAQPEEGAQAPAGKVQRPGSTDQTCHRCGRSGGQRAMLPCRYRGRSLWVCTGCLPALIHG